MYPSIEWDEDGYPTEESLQAFKDAGYQSGDALRVIREELKKCSEVNCSYYDEEPHEDMFHKPVWRIYFSTGGWSGAEELIRVMLAKWDVAYCHVQWNKGGHYIFEVPRD